MSPTRKLLLAVHVACATTSLGACAMGLAMLTGQPASSPVVEFTGSVRLLTGGLAAQVLALGTGLVIACCSRWGLFRYGWVVKKLCLTSVGLFVQGTLEVLGHRPATPLWQLEIGLGAVLLLALLSTVLSVYKPGARLGTVRQRDRLTAIGKEVQ